MTATVEVEILSYLEMCRREQLSLQRGMNFGAGKPHSVILMSQRKGAPYVDAIIDNGMTLIYQGHDVPRTAATPSPKTQDQREFLPSAAMLVLVWNACLENLCVLARASRDSCGLFHGLSMKRHP